MVLNKLTFTNVWFCSYNAFASQVYQGINLAVVFSL